MLPSARLVFAPPHPASKPFLVGGIIVFLLGLLFSWWLVWLGAAFTLFCLYFFRDPERVPPGRVGVILAPADGKVVTLTTGVPPPELGLGDKPRWRIGIFLSLFNVHVNRIPADGTVTRIVYRHGRFLDASTEEAATSNERNALAIRLADDKDLAVVQIAGWVARRIVCDVHEGDVVSAGSRFGIIRFGSRTELYLPEGVSPLVALGQTMVGGETVVAELR